MASSDCLALASADWLQSLGSSDWLWLKFWLHLTALATILASTAYIPRLSETLSRMSAALHYGMCTLHSLLKIVYSAVQVPTDS